MEGAAHRSLAGDTGPNSVFIRKGRLSKLGVLSSCSVVQPLKMITKKPKQQMWVKKSRILNCPCVLWLL